MAQTVRLTITPDMEKALKILEQATLGTLNTTELIKMAVGNFANLKKIEASKEDKEVSEMNAIGARLFYEWAKEDGSLEVDNIAHPERLRPFVPKPYVRTR